MREVCSFAGVRRAFVFSIRLSSADKWNGAFFYTQINN